MGKTTNVNRKLDTYNHLGVEIDRHDVRIEAGLNPNLKLGHGEWTSPADSLFTYRTILEVEGHCIYPENRVDETFNIMLVAEAEGASSKQTLKDIQALDRAGLPAYKKYRG